MRKVKIVSMLALSMLFVNLSTVFSGETFSSLESRYLSAYGLVRQAFEDKSRGQLDLAVQKFSQAAKMLEEIQKKDPQWHVEPVQYLQKDCIRQIAAIRTETTAAPKPQTNRLVNEVLRIQSSRRQRIENPTETSSAALPSLKQKLAVAKQKPVKKTKRDTAMQQEKLAALEEVFLKQKKELEQWQLQYAVLEEKTKEEIYLLSSQFAKEKGAQEFQIQSLEKQIAKLHQNQETKQAEEEKLQAENIAASMTLKNQFAAEKKKWEADLTSLGLEKLKIEKEKEAKIQELEKKLVLIVRDQAVREEKTKELEKQIAALTQSQSEAEKRIKEYAAQEQKMRDSESKTIFLTEKNETLARKLETQTQLSKEYQSKFLKQQVDLKDLQAKIDKLDEEKTFFLKKEEEWIAQKEKTDILNQTVAQLQNEIATREVSLRNIDTETKTKMSQLKEENEKTIVSLLESLKREKEKWAKESDALKNKLSEQEQALVLLRNREEKVQDFSKIEKEKAQLEEELQSLKSVVRNLEAQKMRSENLAKLLENSENEKKGLYEEANRLTSSISQLRLDQKRLEDINLQLRESLASLSQTGEDSKELAQVESLEEEISQLSVKELNKILTRIKQSFNAEKYEEVLSLIDEKLQKYPHNDTLLFYQGLTYSRLLKLDQAIAAYEATIEYNPQFAKAYNNLGNIYSQQKKYGKAIENLKKATQLNPRLAEAYNNMGIVYSHLGQFDEAIKSFIHATDIDSNLIAPYYNLGQLYFQDDKLAAAYTSFEKILIIDPNHSEAKRYITLINEQRQNSQFALDPQAEE